jgi:hypothetical protein
MKPGDFTVGWNSGGEDPGGAVLMLVAKSSWLLNSNMMMIPWINVPELNGGRKDTPG